MTDHIAPVNPPSLMKPVGFAHGGEVKRGPAGGLVAQFRAAGRT